METEDMIQTIITFITSITINDIVLTILGLDTLRSVLASLGIVKRETPFLGRIIYGKYDVIIVKEALRELGYSTQQAERIVGRLKNVTDKEKYPQADTALRLLYILSKYIIKFENVISYGLISEGKMLSYSNYYINTMEATHNQNDLKELSHIMIRLLRNNKEDRVDFIIVPKGGNPLLAQYIANELGANLIIAKDINDSARPQESGELDRIGRIRYEGLNFLLERSDTKQIKGIVLDCNTSGGTQLVTIISDFNDLVEKCNYPIVPICNCYVLFKLVKLDINSGKEINIDKKFDDINCHLFRLFDLDEEDKKELCNISSQVIDYYVAYETGVLHELKNKIIKKSKYYYDE